MLLYGSVKTAFFHGDPVTGTGGIDTNTTRARYPAASAGYSTTGRVTLVAADTLYNPPTGYVLLEA